MAERCLKVCVYGRVQGVGFRAATRSEALALGLTGYARNRADGSVEVLARGGQEAVDQLVNWLRQGPALAKVSQVQVEECERFEADSFSIG